MEMQSACCLHSNRYPFKAIAIQPCLGTKLSQNHPTWRTPRSRTQGTNFPSFVQYSTSDPRFIITNASSSESKNVQVPSKRFDRPEPFGGKSGSISFYGLTHHVIEEGNLVSAPFNKGKGSALWPLAPIALISSLVLPQFFLANVLDSIKDDILAEIIASVTSEAMFYFGLAAFLLIADHVQKPYLQFSPKRWGLITGLNGYLSSAFIAMGFKVVVPLVAVYVTWSPLGLASAVAVAPFIIGCAAQFAFEGQLDKRGSSCWPLLPIIFEVYRLYQLTKAAHFIEKLMMPMRDAAVSAQTMERTGALVGVLISFQVLGVVCLWSLLTFLLRLFPSRPVAEKY